MKHFKWVIVSAAVCLLALSSFVFFRSVPVSRLWKGYQVLYVTSATMSESDVLAVLQEAGCKQVVAKATQQIPIIAPFSPVQVQTEDSYLNRRNAFFTDQQNRAMVFYIPEGQDMAVSRALRVLNDTKNTDAGTDGAASFPWISPLLCVGFAALCLFFAKNKRVLAPAAFFLLAFSFSRPLLTTSAAVCLALYGFFLLQKIWGRKGFVKSANNPLAVLCLLVPLVLLCVSSPLSAFFYAVALVAAFCALLLVALLKSLYDEQKAHGSFTPVLIRSARLIPLVERKEVKLILALALAVVAILLVSVVGATVQSVPLDSAQPALPAPVAGKNALPDLDDFMAWSWNTVTFPYRKMTERAPQVPMDGDSVTMTEFAEADWRIAGTEKTVFVFNSAFRNSLYDSVRKLPYPALEKMLVKQGKDTRYSYAKGGAVASERFGTALLILFLLIPLGIVGYFVVIRRHYGIRF